MSKQELIATQIEELYSAIPELHGVLLASAEGQPIAHAMSNGDDAGRLAALAANAAKMASRVTGAIDNGEPQEVNIRCEEGNMFIYYAGRKALLALVGPESANTGLIHLEARHTAQQIGELFA